MKTLALILMCCSLFISPITLAKYEGYTPTPSERSSKSKQSNGALKVNSSKQAAQIVKSRFGGKVLKVQKSKSGYKVKLVKNNGHVVTVSVDAKTGRVR